MEAKTVPMRGLVSCFVVTIVGLLGAMPASPQTTVPCPAQPGLDRDYVVAGTGIDPVQYAFIPNVHRQNLIARYAVDFANPGTASFGEDFDLYDLNETPMTGSGAFFYVRTRVEGLPLWSRLPAPNMPHELFELLAAHAYDDWQEGESIEERLAAYYNLRGLGYRVQKVFGNRWDFQAVGLTSVEWFNLKVDWYYTDGSWTGLPSYFLRVYIYDNDRPPILAIRGTQPSLGHALDFLTDLDPIGVGYSQFNSNRLDVEDWLKCVSDPFRELDDPNLKYQYRPHVTGHSLGGALTQWVASSYTRSGNRLGQIVTFNSPGIARDAFGDAGTDRFRADRADAVTHYVTSGDVASLAGRAFLRPGSLNQAQGVPNWVRSRYITDANGLFAPLLEKHSVPVIAPGVYKNGEWKTNPVNPATGQDYYTDVNWLSDPFFTYLPDPDYFAYLVSVAQKGNAFAITAAYMVFRITVENIREGIGDVLDDAIDAVDAWEAAKQWGPKAWEAIIKITKNIVSGGQGSLEKEGMVSLSGGATNFWEAVGQWPPEAWQASVQWPDYAWTVMSDTWTPGHWSATVAPDFPWQETPNWTQQDWENMTAAPVRRISGMVYDDKNANGINDQEPGIGAAVVYLDLDRNGRPDRSDIQTRTQVDGTYTLFTTLPEGTYDLRQSLDDRWEPIAPADGKHVLTFNADPAQEITGADFGNQCLFGCSGTPISPKIKITRITKDAFLGKATKLENEDPNEFQMDPLDTGISTSEYVCSVFGYKAIHGDIEESGRAGEIIYAYLEPKDLQNPNDTTWSLAVDFKTGYQRSDWSEIWDVDILCLSRRVASYGGPEPGKPIFVQKFSDLRPDRGHDSGIRTDQYVCGIGGFNSHLGDINEKDVRDIITAYVTPVNGNWNINASFATHTTVPDNWDVNLLCASTKIARVGDLRKGKSISLKELRHLGDDVNVDTGLSSTDRVCGVVGFAALHGNVNENATNGKPLLFAYTHSVNNRWYFRGDFRTEGEHESWDRVNILCLAKGDSVVPPNYAPEIAPILKQYVTLGFGETDVRFEVSADDVNDDEIELSASSLPAGAQFEPKRGVSTLRSTFRWTVPDPGEMEYREYPVTFVAADQETSTARTAVIRVCGTRIVDCVNLRYLPRINPIPDQKAQAGQKLSFTVHATDKDLDIIRLRVRCRSTPIDPFTQRCDDGPVGALFTLEHEIEGSTASVFSWTPMDAGTYPITFNAHDGIDGQDFLTVNVTVTGLVSLPDLTVTGFPWPTRASGGAILNFVYMLKNEGNAGAFAGNGGFRTELLVDGKPAPNENGRVGSRLTPSLAAGSSSTNGFQWLATCGTKTVETHTISIRTDAGGQVREKWENNNETPVHTLTVDCPLPDLVVEEVCLENRLCEGTTTTLAARVRNSGLAASAPSTTSFLLYKSACRIDQASLA
ncbi:MAG: CARDB domain-containing protein, partial [Vicinamibacteria bacterium]